MTLIAFATYGADRAEFITDTASYTARVTKMGRTTKHLTINHLDAAVLTQGDGAFGGAAQVAAVHLAGQVATYDELTDNAQTWLSGMWSDLAPADDESTVFLLGWSDRAGKFVAYGYASENEFARFKIPGLWAMPASWDMRPSTIELERMKGWMDGHPDRDEAARIWAARPTRPAPRSRQEWIDLAIESREQRSLSGGFAHVIVAGDVFHTVLKRGSVRTEKVHQFNDSGEEFLRMVEGTEHPLALAGPCYCESGNTYGECCSTVDVTKV